MERLRPTAFIQTFISDSGMRMPSEFCGWFLSFEVPLPFGVPSIEFTAPIDWIRATLLTAGLRPTPSPVLNFRKTSVQLRLAFACSPDFATDRFPGSSN